jgi:outer membrane protein
MPNMKKIHVLLSLMAFTYFASGQSADSTYNFTIKQAVDYALQHQKDVLNAELDAEIAVHKVRETVGIGLPQLNASFDLKDFEKIPVSLVPAEFFGGEKGSFVPIQFGTRWNATAGLSASQLIFDPSYIVGVSASKTYRELSRKNLERTKLETAVTITKAYYSVLLLRERKKVIDANIARLKKLSSDTKAMYDNGFVEKIDADRTQVAYNNIVSESENFNRLVEITDKMLKFQMGLPQSANLIIADSLDTQAIKNLSASTDKADPAKRIEYSILKTQEQLQQYNLKRYKGQYIPSLVAYGSLNAVAQRSEFNVFNPDYRWYPTGIIGATLSINLFDGMQRENKIRQEKLALRKIDNELYNFENAISFEVSSGQSKLNDALSSLKIQDKNLELATSVSSITKLKYDQGVGSNLEVLDAETSLKEAQVNYFNALYDAVIAKIDLEKSLGNFSY